MKPLVWLVVLAACSKAEKAKTEDKPAAPGKPGAIVGTIDVAPAQKAKLTPGHALFVSAKRGQSGPPLAAEKLEIGAYPIAFELSAADQMIKGGPPLDGDVELTVRFDSDGDVMTKLAGDLVWKGPATVGGPGISVMVTEVLP